MPTYRYYYTIVKSGQIDISAPDETSADTEFEDIPDAELEFIAGDSSQIDITDMEELNEAGQVQDR